MKCTCMCVNWTQNVPDFEEDVRVSRWFKVLVVTHLIIQMGLLALPFFVLSFFSRIEAKPDRTYLEPVSADEMADCPRSCRGKKC